MALFCSYSYSYSEIKNDISKNAATGLTWTMHNILPYTTGLTVDGVIYQYTAVKNTADPMGVTIQNRNATSDDNNYVFRNRDDWTGLRGNTITKVIPVDNIPSALWGNGEIKVDGIGEVKNQSVVYKYRYDTCIIDPLSSPTCPGYTIPKQLVNEPVDIKNEFINSSKDSSFLCLPTDVICLENKFEKNESVKEKKSDNNKKSIVNLLLTPSDVNLTLQLEAMSAIPEFYTVSLPGGAYKDVVSYPDKSLPDNKNGRRLGFAQERLHQTLVDSQYEIK